LIIYNFLIRKRMKRLFTIAFIALTTWSFGQVDVDILIDTLNIPATNIPASIATTGRNVSIITRKDIETLPVTTIDEMLKYIPGIEVQSRNGFGAQSDISMRGSTYTQVLILIDGMRLNDPLTAHFNSNIPVGLSEIERIEVLRGPAASMYGPDAVGGVIHIITKTFATAHKKGTNTEANIELDYGQSNLVRGNLGFFHNRDKIKIGASILANKSTGQEIAAQTFANGSDTTSLEGYNNYFDVRTATVSFSAPISDDWQLSFRSAVDWRDFSARYFYTSNAFDKSTETTGQLWLQGQAVRVGTKSSTVISAAYKYNEDEFIFSPDFSSTNNHQTQFANFQVNHLVSVNDALDIKAGVQADYRTIVSNDRGDHEDIHLGAYAIAVYRPMSDLQLVGSVRGDYDENYNIEFVPQVNATYQPMGQLSIRAAAGRSIRAADYTERYVSFNLENLTPGRNLGNPDLMAESSWSEEIGIDFKPIPEWRLSGTAFFRQGTNLIDYVVTNENDITYNTNLRDSADYFLATNIADVSTRGFELESWYSRKMGSNLFVSWGIGYTYLNTSNEEGVVSAYLSNHARHLVNTNLVAAIDKFTFSLNGLYKNRAGRIANGINSELTENYTVWNAKVDWKITKELAAHIMIHNLFDEQYADVLGAKMPNRWIMGGIRWNL
jgi:vitamin B12 transporter